MKKMIRHIVQQKFKQITPTELMQYGKQYGFHLNQSQADQIISYIRNHSLDPLNEEDRFKLLKKIAQITDQNTARKAYKLFQDITKKYGLQDMF